MAILIASGIATTYSAFGGIRSVTFTDILQFFAFGCIIPLVGFIIWSEFYNEGYKIAAALDTPVFNFDFIFIIINPSSSLLIRITKFWIMSSLSRIKK